MVVATAYAAQNIFTDKYKQKCSDNVVERINFIPDNIDRTKAAHERS